MPEATAKNTLISSKNVFSFWLLTKQEQRPQALTTIKANGPLIAKISTLACTYITYERKTKVNITKVLEKIMFWQTNGAVGFLNGLGSKSFNFIEEHLTL